MLPDWFQKIDFLNGLPRSGKSLRIYKIVDQDYGQDLCLNLRKHKTIDYIRYTVNYIKARGRKPIPAFRIPKYSKYARVKFLQLFKATHPKIKHVLIDEVERYHIHRLVHLCEEIHRLYPAVPIILVGIIKNCRNRFFPTSQFLLAHCHSVNVNPKCKFCSRQSAYMLNVYHHHKITYSKIDTIGNRDVRHRIKSDMKRYHVCQVHYNDPPRNQM